MTEDTRLRAYIHIRTYTVRMKVADMNVGERIRKNAATRDKIEIEITSIMAQRVERCFLTLYRQKTADYFERSLKKSN